MRNAFYTGEFKTAIYELTAKYQDDNYWGKGDRVFSKPTTDRMANQQFVSDLVVAMIKGEAQHQSKLLDEFYETYDKSFPDKKVILVRFKKTIDLIKKIFPDTSRFTKNLSDFYTLFLYVDELSSSRKVNFDKDNIGVLDATLHKFELDYAAYLERRSSDKPDSTVFERYRETIVGRQREKEVRDERREILHNLIEPGLKYVDLDPQRLFSEEQKDYIWQISKDKKCGICGKVVTEYEDYEPDHIKPWSKGGRTSIANGQIAHKGCNRSKKESE